MRVMEMIEQAARQAQVAGGMTFLSLKGSSGEAGGGLPAGADPRWRPGANPIDGSLVVDPGFALPTVAGPLTWRLFFDSTASGVDGEYGYGRRASFPLRLLQSGSTVTVMHEDGTLRGYTGSAGVYTATGALNGDKLVTQVDNTWDETLGDSGLKFHYPSGSYVSLQYRATPQDRRITHNYSSGQLLYLEEPAGRRVTLAYNADGKVQTIEDWGERGQLVLTYEGSDLTEVWEQEGVLTRYGYDASTHKLTSITDPELFITTYTYDGSGRLWTRNVAGNVSTYTYVQDGSTFHTGYTDPLQRTWTHLSTGGYPSGKFDPLGNQETYTYVNNKPLEFESALGYKTSFAYDSNGYFLAVRDALGNRTTFQRDSYGNVTTVINALGYIITLGYGGNAALRQLEKVVNPLGYRLTMSYYDTGLPQSIEDEAGYRTTFVWNTRGELTSVVNARGFLWTMTYNALGNPIELLEPLGYRWTYSYDYRGRLVGNLTPLRDRWTTVFDTRDMVQGEIDPLGFRVTYLHNAEGSLSEVIDELGNRVTSVYDEANQLKAIIDPLLYRTSISYDRAGRATVIEDALGFRQTLIYDADSRQIGQIDPVGYRTSFGYDALGRVVTTTNANGAVTTYLRDALGQTWTITDALGSLFTIVYDAAGQVIARCNPLGYRGTLEYDARGLVRTRISPTGTRLTYSYSPTGVRESMQDARGHIWTTVFDAWDRVEAIVNPLQCRATRIYDPIGRLSAVWDARGYRWTQSYDARNLEIGTLDPLGRRSTLSYNAAGLLVTFTDGEGQLGTYTYSPRYELSSEVYADGTRVTRAYDAVGQVRTVVDATGRYTMTYNARGEKLTDQAPQFPAGNFITYGYDTVGNQTLVHSWLGRQTMLYDLLNRCTLMWDPDGNTTRWLYDGLQRPTMQFNWNGTRTTWMYDARGRAGLIRHTKDDGTLLGLASYTWDANADPLSRASLNGVTTTWTYDDAGQLKSEWYSGGIFDTFTYDPAGNSIQRERTASGSLSIATYRYDAAGQPVTIVQGTTRTTFVFDLNGNLRSEETAPDGRTTFTWDPLGRLSEAQLPSGARTTYTYRYDDLRATTDVGSGVQKFVWQVPGPSGLGDLLEELNPAGSLQRAYFRAMNLVTQKEPSGSSVFHWIDGGTAQILTDLNQAVTVSYDFSAWGELFGSTGSASTSLSWNGDWGYYRDTAQWTWVRARHLDVLRGRWLSQDPLGFTSHLNPYAYADNNPMVFVDPSGEWIQVVLIIFALLVISEKAADKPSPTYQHVPLFTQWPFSELPIARDLLRLSDLWAAITGCDPILQIRLSWEQRLERLVPLVPVPRRLAPAGPGLPAMFAQRKYNIPEGGGLYEFRELTTGKTYVGQTEEFRARTPRHIRRRRTKAEDILYTVLQAVGFALRVEEQKRIDEFGGIIECPAGGKLSNKRHEITEPEDVIEAIKNHGYTPQHRNKDITKLLERIKKGRL